MKINFVLCIALLFGVLETSHCKSLKAQDDSQREHLREKRQMPAVQPGVPAPAGQPGVPAPAGQPGVPAPAGQPPVTPPGGQPGVPMGATPLTTMPALNPGTTASAPFVGAVPAVLGAPVGGAVPVAAQMQPIKFPDSG